MRIAFASDWHVGITNPKSIKKQLRKMKKDEPDLIIHAGDYCGGFDGPRSVNTIMRFTRETLPDVPIVATIGNHELFSLAPSEEQFWRCYGPDSDTARNMKRWGVHFLDEDGPFIHGKFPHIGIAGAMGWYHDLTVANADPRIYAHVEGDTGRYLQKRFEETTIKQLDVLAEWENITKRIFISHFPVVELEGRDLKWGGNEVFGHFIQNQYDIGTFLNGHMHGDLNGPVRYECGADYEKPNYKIIEVE